MNKYLKISAAIVAEINTVTLFIFAIKGIWGGAFCSLLNLILFVVLVFAFGKIEALREYIKNAAETIVNLSKLVGDLNGKIELMGLIEKAEENEVE